LFVWLLGFFSTFSFVVVVDKLYSYWEMRYEFCSNPKALNLIKDGGVRILLALVFRISVNGVSS
jgi:hypothetical protein